MLDCCESVFGFVPNSHAKNAKPLAVVFVVDLFERSACFATARSAPACPEIHHHNVAFSYKVAQAGGYAVLGSHCEVHHLASLFGAFNSLCGSEQFFHARALLGIFFGRLCKDVLQLLQREIAVNHILVERPPSECVFLVGGVVHHHGIGNLCLDGLGLRSQLVVAELLLAQFFQFFVQGIHFVVELSQRVVKLGA